MASELLQSCASLVNEQNLQREGWLAVIANLENIARYARGDISLSSNYGQFPLFETSLLVCFQTSPVKQVETIHLLTIYFVENC